jgi:hypothetical protein
VGSSQTLNCSAQADFFDLSTDQRFTAILTAKIRQSFISRASASSCVMHTALKLAFER